MEAKSSAPNPNTVSSDPQNGFETYVSDLVEKFDNTLELFLGSKLGFPHLTVSQTNTPDLMPLNQVSNYKIRFCLVIKNQKSEFLPPVKNALEKRLRRKLKIWNAEVMVLNESLAKSKSLIS
ncbi:MAG: hypothetical protein R3Y63_05780 [Eubacteriales bacterium]